MKQARVLKIFVYCVGLIFIGIYAYFIILALQPAVTLTGKAPVWAEVSVQSVNLHSQPDFDSHIVSIQYWGHRLTIIKEAQNWLEVRDENGQVGWVYREYTVLSPPGLE